MAEKSTMKQLIDELASAGKTVLAVGLGVAGGKLIVRGIDEVMGLGAVQNLAGPKTMEMIRKGVKPVLLIGTTAAAHYMLRNKKDEWNKNIKLASIGTGVIGLDELVKIFHAPGVLGAIEGGQLEIMPLDIHTRGIGSMYNQLQRLPDDKFDVVNMAI